MTKKNDWLWEKSVECVKRHNRFLKIWEGLIAVCAVLGLVLAIFAQEDGLTYAGWALLGSALGELALYWVFKFAFEYMDLMLSMNYIIADHCRKSDATPIKEAAKRASQAFDPYDEYD